ncbi:MAG: ABC transporter permease [Acidimicrobiia bacterium]|nr:ABC transporter permease [Acidimicrobiia bacterium]
MAAEFESAPDPGQVADWELELQKVGFARRVLMARKWYKTDWWFVAISSAMVVAFLIVAAVPQWLASHDPLEQVGPRLLAPGELPEQEILVVPIGGAFAAIAEFEPGVRTPVAVAIDTPSSEAARDEAERVTAEIAAAGGEGRIRLQIERYETAEEALAGVEAGEAVAAVISSKTYESIAAEFPALQNSGAVSSADQDSTSFPLGTNQVGQDVLSRLIWGARIAIIIGFSASIASFVIGVPLGLLAGFAGGKLDRAMTLVMDSIYAFPGLILAIAITAVLGPSIFNIIVAIAVLYIPTYYRIVRGQTLQSKEELYVEAARSLGAKSKVILTRYIFPNVIPSVAVIFSVNVADAILTGAGLSFLGLGLPPSTPDWGIDLARGQEFIRSAWWLITFPGLAVMLIVLAFTMMGEGLVEIFNPKLRER